MDPESNTISQVGGSTVPEPVSKSNSPSKATYNLRCPAVKRLMREAAELANPDNDFAAHPTESNLFEWHFTIRGPEGSEFENGLYHGRIIFPTEYPMKPPSFILLTPNGRFQTDEKICLSISNYHPETWLPSWSIGTALVALRSFMCSPGNEGAIGSVNFSPEERKKLACKSQKWECHECGPIVKLLPKITVSNKVNGEGDATRHTSPPVTSTSAQRQEDSTDFGNRKDNAHVQAKFQTVTTKSTATNTDNQDAIGTEAGNSATESEIQAQQQNEPIKNIIYDLGIGCFVVLILALCLRRLLAIFFRM